MATNTQINDQEWKWVEFVKIGKLIDGTLYSQAQRTDYAKLALTLSKDFVDLDVLSSQERVALYLEITGKCYSFLQEGESDVMKTAVAEHLSMKHVEQGGSRMDWGGVNFYPKQRHVYTCVVNEGTTLETRYFVKTRQYDSGSMPDLKEVFVYKLLECIRMGPETDFIIPSHYSTTSLHILILTKSCSNIVLLSDLTPATVNLNALLQIDLISRILCLRDCCTNSSNCGQVEDGKPTILDFGIVTLPEYSKPDVIKRFLNDGNELNYTAWMKWATSETSTIAKLDVIKRSMNEWDLLSNIEKAESYARDFAAKAPNGTKFHDDLANYIDGIGKTIKTLQEAISNDSNDA